MDRFEALETIEQILDNYPRVACWDSRQAARVQSIDAYATKKGLILLNRVRTGKRLESWEVFVPVTQSLNSDETLAALRAHLGDAIEVTEIPTIECKGVQP